MILDEKGLTVWGFVRGGVSVLWWTFLGCVATVVLVLLIFCVRWVWRRQRVRAATRFDRADAFVVFLEENGRPPSRQELLAAAARFREHLGSPLEHARRLNEDDAYRQGCLVRAARRLRHREALEAAGLAHL